MRVCRLRERSHPGLAETAARSRSRCAAHSRSILARSRTRDRACSGRGIQRRAVNRCHARGDRARGATRASLPIARARLQGYSDPVPDVSRLASSEPPQKSSFTTARGETVQVDESLLIADLAEPALNLRSRLGSGSRSVAGALGRRRERRRSSKSSQSSAPSFTARWRPWRRVSSNCRHSSQVRGNTFIA